MEGPIGFGWMRQDLHPAGVCGDAARANAGRGARLLDHLGGSLAALLREVAPAWSAGLAYHRLAPAGHLPEDPSTFAADAAAVPRPMAGTATQAPIASLASGWQASNATQGDAQVLLDLYLPLLARYPGEPLALGHLGQSLDGFIATSRGESCFVTGPENILHLHRLRALFDAVVVGAETAAADNARRTTRLVPGDDPVRVVHDHRLRLRADRRVLQDGAAPTLLVCTEGAAGSGRRGLAEILAVPASGGRLRALHRRGPRRLFVEGGGVTVSAFLAAGLLDRLQVAVTPLLIGEGRRGLSLPAGTALGDCLRPTCRVFRMGSDILFDCEPRGRPSGGDPGRGPALARIC